MRSTVIKTAAVTIASGSAVSGAADLAGGSLLRIHMPASWTTAGLSFQISEDGTTYRDVYDSSGEATRAAAAGRCLQFDPAQWHGIRFLKLRSGTTGSPVNQGADRVLTLEYRGFN